MPLLSYLLDKKVPKTLSILTCCTAASIITFPLDRLRTQFVAKKQLQTQWWKGLGYRLLFQNLFIYTCQRTKYKRKHICVCYSVSTYFIRII
jgi:hypothetical protein